MQVEDKIVLITGANSGIGKATAEGIASLGATVAMVCRNPERGQKAHQEILKKSKNDNIFLFLADLSLQSEILSLRDQFKDQFERLDVLINNAGVYLPSVVITKEGIEKTLATNHIAYFLLTKLLLPQVKKSKEGRIINVASEAHHGTDPDFPYYQGENKYAGWKAYKQTKLANLLFTYHLANQVKDENITVNALHPGVVRTNIASSRKIIGFMWRMTPFFISSKKAAQTPIHLAVSPELKGITGQYLANKKPIQSSPQTHDKTHQKKLWEITEKLLISV